MHFDVVSDSIFYAVSPDLSQKKYADLDSAIRSNPYLIIYEISGSWYNYGYKNAIYEYYLYDCMGKPIFEILESNWKLKELEVRTDYYVQKIEIYGKIVDPNGQSTNLSYFGRYEAGVVKAIKKLREMAVYESIENYNLALENIKLKDEVERMKHENNVTRILIANSQNSTT